MQGQSVTERGWRVRFSRAAGWPDGAFDALFTRPADDRTVSTVRWPDAPHDGELINAPIRRHVVAAATDQLIPALRERAADRLPAHERPAAYVIVTELPVSDNGKLDHAALPAPVSTRPRLSTDYTRPVLPIEQQIAQAMAEILEVGQVGLHDDFIELGGDSLQAVRLSGKLSERFDVDLPTRTVFDAPTVARLAALVTGSGPRRRPPAAGIARESARLPLSPTQAALRALCSAAWSATNPRFALEVRYRIRGPLDRSALATAVDQTVAWQAGLRVAVHVQGEPQDAHQIVHPPAGQILRSVDSDRDDPGEALQARQEAGPLDPAAGKVFAADLVGVSGHDHLLGLRLHSLVGDEVSVGILEKEIGRRYNALRAGREPALPPSNYAALIAPASTAPRPEDRRYWNEKLAECAPIELIPDGALGTAGDQRMRVQSLLVPAGPSRALLEMARIRRLTFATVLYAPLCAIIAADTGDPDTRFLAVKSVRTDSLAHTVGAIGDMALLRHRLRPELPVAEALAAAHRDMHEALRHDSVSLIDPRRRIPRIAELFARSQTIYYDVLRPLTGLRLDGCSIERSDQMEEDFPNPADAPAQIGQFGIIVRKEECIRLAVQYHDSYAPASYVRSLLARLRDIITACTRPGAPPLAALAEPDAWLTRVRNSGTSAPS